MNINFHEHVTGLELIVAILLEVAWWCFIIFVVRRWWKRRHDRRSRVLPDIPYPTADYSAMRADQRGKS